MKGTVARIVADRGFGFIEGEDGREFFFHQSALSATDFGELAPGIPVEFEVSDGEAGDRSNEQPRAVGVHLPEGATPAVDHEILPPGKTR